MRLKYITFVISIFCLYGCQSSSPVVPKNSVSGTPDNSNAEPISSKPKSKIDDSKQESNNQIESKSVNPLTKANDSKSSDEKSKTNPLEWDVEESQVVGDMVSLMLNNPLRFESKYENKVVRVDGNFDGVEIKDNILSVSIFQFSWSSSAAKARVIFLYKKDKWKKIIAKFDKGDPVRVEGAYVFSINRKSDEPYETEILYFNGTKIEPIVYDGNKWIPKN